MQYKKYTEINTNHMNTNNFNYFALKHEITIYCARIALLH